MQTMEFPENIKFNETNMEEKLLPPDLLSCEDESSPREFDQKAPSHMFNTDVINCAFKD